MKHKEADVVIIGHGSAGASAYKAARKHTEKIIIIQNGEYGGTCARTGCMPSKLLIAAGNAAKSMKEASSFGISSGEIKINGKEVMKRVRDLRDQFVSRVMKDVDDIPKENKIQGFARFLDNNTLEVGDIKITAKAVVIATGSSSRLFPEFEKLKDRGIINDDIFQWEDLPESIAIFGTGIIGMEIGQALERLGVRVTIFGRSGHVGSFSDPEIQDAADNLYHGELDIFPGAEVQKMVLKGDQVNIRFNNMHGEEFEQTFDSVLSAIGRNPNISGIGLENTDIELDPRGMPIFNTETLQCGKSNIFITGDANGYLTLLHEAIDEGSIAGRNAALFPKVKKTKRRVPIAVVFTDPEMAVVGKMYRELKEGSFVTGSVDFIFQKRSQIMGKNRGMLNVYIDKESKKLLGAEMIGPQTEHIAHLLSWSIGFDAKLDQLLKMPFYHPTVEEAVYSALKDAKNKLSTFS